MTTVSSDAFWIVAVGSLDPGAASAGYFETRRHMSTVGESGYRQAGPAWYMARVGRPYRNWDTAELQATIDRIPACRVAREAGHPVTVVAWKSTSSTPALDSLAFGVTDTIASALSGARRVGSSAVNAATNAANAVGDNAGAIGAGVGAFATLVALGPWLLALSGLVVLFYFRKPLLGALKRGV